MAKGFVTFDGMDRLEHRCAVSADLTLARFLTPASRVVMMSSAPSLFVELREKDGRKVLRHVLSMGLFRRSWDAELVSEDATSLTAGAASGFETFRHELRLADGSLHSLIEWSGSDLSDALAKAKLAVPLREEGTAVDRPTTRIVLGSQSAAA